MSSPPDPTQAEIRLAELLEVFQETREKDASAGIGLLREEAGELFPELVDLAECLGVLHASVGVTDSRVPASIGPYEIEAELGYGVSGNVYRASREGHPVALKVMRESLALSPAALRRFLREIEVARQLDHPHIVKIVDHGDAGERLYLATELVDGCSLSAVQSEIKACGDAPSGAWLEVLDRYGVPPGAGTNPAEAYGRRMAGLFAPVADALAHAHARGLVHRDLKPGNLLLGRDGKLRVIDFGLAKVLGEEITSTVAVLGTPGFMSPEQAAGRSRDVDARSDIYGLGASLYHTLTSAFPVEATSFSEMLAAILTQKPRPLRAHCAAYPRGLELVLSRCLEKEREDRYADAGALADDLERAARGRVPRIGHVPIARRFRRYAGRHRKQTGIAAAVVLVLAVMAGWVAWRPVSLSIHVVPEARVAVDGNAVGSAPWNGDVRRGEHRLRITRERFVPIEDKVEIEEATRLVYHLRPVDPFGELSLLAGAYGGNADLPAAVRPRGASDEPVVAEITDPGALAERLRSFPEEVRGEPFARLFAIHRLLEDGLFAEAFEAAKALAEEHPGRAEPLKLVLAALDRLGFTDRREYGVFFRRLQEAER